MRHGAGSEAVSAWRGRPVAVFLIAAAPSLLAPAGAPAQECVGAPLEAGDRAVSAAAALAEHDFRRFLPNEAVTGTEVTGRELGVTARSRPSSRLGIRAGAALRDMEDSGADPILLEAGASYSISSLPIVSALPLESCVASGLAAAFVSEGAPTSFTSLTVPFALAFGTRALEGDDLLLTPYVVPQLLYSRLSGDVLGVSVERSDTDLGLAVGAGARLGRAIGTFELFVSGLDPAVGTAAYPDRRLALTLGVVF